MGFVAFQSNICTFFTAIETFVKAMQLHILFMLLIVSVKEKYGSRETGSLSTIKTRTLRNLQNCLCSDNSRAVWWSSKYKLRLIWNSIQKGFISESVIGVLFVLGEKIILISSTHQGSRRWVVSPLHCNNTSCAAAENGGVSAGQFTACFIDFVRCCQLGQCVSTCILGLSTVPETEGCVNLV